MSSGNRPLSKQIVVRVDGDLLDWLQRDAESHGRTIAQSVRFLLRSSLKQEADQ